MRYKVVMIGVGALGKRHLSSIMNTKLPLDVFCYDINSQALNNFEWDNKYNNKTLAMVSSFDDFPKKIDFALFAMTSTGRREMFEQLISHCKVKNILFEKVLFQKIEDYGYVGRRLNELNIKAWVNCARRQMDSYQELARELAFARDIRISLAGGEWGMACNAIHMIDLIEFISGGLETKIDKMQLLPEIANSKRKGFKEVYGSMEGHSGKCSHFSITCMKNSSSPITLFISTDVGQYIIIESKRKIISMTEKNNYELTEKVFDMPYQSQMTQHVLEDILLTGNSRLAPFDVSSRLHLEFIKPLIKFFNENGLGCQSCPIT